MQDQCQSDYEYVLHSKQLSECELRNIDQYHLGSSVESVDARFDK